MKRFVVGMLAVLFLFVAIGVEAEIPQDKMYIIEMAAFSISLDIRDEDAGTANHYERLLLANRVISSPGNMALKLAKIAESATFGTAINWESVTDNQIKTAMLGIWNHVALASYGDAPVQPE